MNSSVLFNIASLVRSARGSAGSALLLGGVAILSACGPASSTVGKSSRAYAAGGDSTGAPISITYFNNGADITGPVIDYSGHYIAENCRLSVDANPYPCKFDVTITQKLEAPAVAASPGKAAVDAIPGTFSMTGNFSSSIAEDIKMQFGPYTVSGNAINNSALKIPQVGNIGQAVFVVSGYGREYFQVKMLAGPKIVFRVNDRFGHLVEGFAYDPSKQPPPPPPTPTPGPVAAPAPAKPTSPAASPTPAKRAAPHAPESPGAPETGGN